MKKIKLLTPVFVGISSLFPATTLLASCGNKETSIDSFYQTTLKEFKEFSKHPHPSFHLDEARSYLTNRITSLGYQVMKDNYGNIWFDIPATKGYESWPKLILQGHMDMVIAEGIPEEQAQTVGIEVVEDKDNQNRPIMHSKDYKTTLGADDGIGVAMILAVAQSNINHGPIRGLITADEEEGLKGATALSSAALDSDYLLNLDGEGEVSKEYVIERGCAGLSRFNYNMEFSGADIVNTSLSNKFSLNVKGFFGQHFSDDVCFKDGVVQTKGSANWFLFDVLNYLIGSSKNVEISKFTPNKLDEEDGNLPQEATVEFATDATEQNVEDAIKIYKDKIPQLYKLDKDSKITTTLTTTTSFTQTLNQTHTKQILAYFVTRSRGAGDADNWEGKTAAEKESLNYPNYNTAFTKFTFSIEGGKGTMFAANRATVGTDNNSDKWYKETVTDWNKLYPNNVVQIKKNYKPWDATGKTKMIDMAVEGFKQAGVTPAIDRTRGGLEPAAFHTKRTTLEQACIGPRIDKIHTKDETLYLDTLPKTMKCLFYVIHNMYKFN